MVVCFVPLEVAVLAHRSSLASPPGTSWALMDAPRVAPPWMAEVSGGDTEVCCELISEDGVFFMDVEPN